MNIKLFSIIGQWGAAVMGAVGLGIEIGMEAHIGYILITAGAIAGFVFTKIRHEYRD